jgi:hypothetical protein
LAAELASFGFRRLTGPVIHPTRCDAGFFIAGLAFGLMWALMYFSLRLVCILYARADQYLAGEPLLRL